MVNYRPSAAELSAMRGIIIGCIISMVAFWIPVALIVWLILR